MNMRSLVVSSGVVLWFSLAACVDTTPPAETGSGGSNGSGGAVVIGGSGGDGSAGSVFVGGSGGGGASGSGGSVVAGSGGSAVTDAGASTDSAIGNDGASDGGTGVDQPPTHPLNVTATKTRHTHNFRSKDADPGVTFNDNTEIATVDPSSHTMVGKLILPFGGLGTDNGITGPVGDFLVRRGYHVLGVAAFQNYNVVIGDPAFYGDARRSVFEGKNYTHKNEFATINLTPSDGVAMRVQKALQYLQKLAPEEDWGYFLNADGSVRWSDVAFTGQSHGASNAPRFAKLVRAWRAVSFAGPRDNECNSLNTPSCEGVVTATWLTEPSATPMDRYYGVTGNQDAQHPQHLFAMYKANYVGQPVNVTTGAPYSNSHRIITDAGHAWFCDETTYKALCNYLFDVPPENANGP
ncbi:MAG TPA: hypothetical protein VGL59_12185 [Polyangia bacterium]